MRYFFIVFFFSIMLVGCAASKKAGSSDAPSRNAVISVLPDSPTYVEALVNADGSISLSKVSKVTKPDVTLTFDLTSSNDGMMLSVKNPLDKTIKFHLDMVDYKGKLHNTSSCPVMAGKGVFEMWPHPIPEIRVSNTHVATESEEGLCIY